MKSRTIPRVNHEAVRWRGSVQGRRTCQSKKFVFERVLTLENPTFVPDFEKFKERYERFAKDKACLALQGHPNAWDEKRWQGFVKIIEYLKSKGCAFMTPSEYLSSLKWASRR